MTSTTSILSGLLLLLSGAAQADEKSKAAEKKSDEKSMSQRMAAMRLEFMKTSVSKYEILLGKEENAKLSLVPEPLLRFTNPVSRAFIGASMGPPLFSDGNLVCDRARIQGTNRFNGAAALQRRKRGRHSSVLPS